MTVNEDSPNSMINLTNVFTDIDDDDSAIVKSAASNTNPDLVEATILGDQLTLTNGPLPGYTLCIGPFQV